MKTGNPELWTPVQTLFTYGYGSTGLEAEEQQPRASRRLQEKTKTHKLGLKKQKFIKCVNCSQYRNVNEDLEWYLGLCNTKTSGDRTETSVME